MLIGTTLPDLRYRFLQGNDAGFIYVEAGLPNITGIMGAVRQGGSGPNILATGAFYHHSTYNANNKTGNSDDWGSHYGFDASRSNPIYGRSYTVQPPALTVRYYIRAK